MPWTWRTLPNGLVEVDSGQGFQLITLTNVPNAPSKRTDTWLDLAKKNAAKFDVPLSWVMGVIYSESGGKPDVRNFCCAGLMALFLKIYGLTEAEGFDPEINVKLGTQTLGDLSRKGPGYELPQVASMYNAGPSALTGGPKTNSKSVWGMAENMPAVPYTGYIEKVVRASNWWRQRELAGELGAPLPRPPGPIEPGPIFDPPVLASSGSGAGAVAFVVALIGGFAVVRSKGVRRLVG